MLLRDRLLQRLSDPTADHQQLVEEVLGIRGAPPELARRLIAQALVVEDRRDVWRLTGERICASAPPTPGVYVLRDAAGAALCVGKAVNLRRRLRAHFAPRRWRAVKPELSRAADAEWTEVGSELEALLREAALIDQLRPPGNVQLEPHLEAREVPAALVRDVIVIVPSIEEDSAELVAARAAGAWMIQRTRRNGADLAVHARRLMRFFVSAIDRFDGPRLAPIVFTWLAGRGAGATRLDPHDVAAVAALKARLAAILLDEELFRERVDQRTV